MGTGQDELLAAVSFVLAAVLDVIGGQLAVVGGYRGAVAATHAPTGGAQDERTATLELTGVF